MTWDRSRRWRIDRTHVHRVRVHVRFASGRPTVAEIAAVRKAYPQFAHIPPRDLQAQLDAAGELVFDDVSRIEANGLARAAAEAGLSATVEKWVEMTALIIDETDPTPVALLVEDAEEEQRLVDEMIAAGVKVVYTIAD